MNFLHLIIPQNFTEFLIIKIQIILNNKTFIMQEFVKFINPFHLIVSSLKVEK